MPGWQEYLLQSNSKCCHPTEELQSVIPPTDGLMQNKFKHRPQETTTYSTIWAPSMESAISESTKDIIFFNIIFLFTFWWFSIYQC
jgi:hypothetical protein